jgi:hypothetical protein
VLEDANNVFENAILVIGFIPSILIQDCCVFLEGSVCSIDTGRAANRVHTLRVEPRISRREPIFRDDFDRRHSLATLAQAGQNNQNKSELSP